MMKPDVIKYFYEGDENDVWDYFVYYPNQHIAHKEIGIKLINMNMKIAYRRGFLNDYSENRVTRVNLHPKNDIIFGKHYRVAKPILEEKDDKKRKTRY